MAENKAVVLYFDRLQAFDFLSITEKGELFDAIIRYARDNELIEFQSRVVQTCFLSLKPAIDKHMEKYEDICQARSDAGKMGGAPKGNQNASKTSKNNQKQAKTSKTSKTSYTETETNTETNTETETDTCIMSGKPDDAHDSKSETITEIIGYLNERTGKRYSPKAEATRKHISARLDEGYSIDDFKRAIDNKAAQWLGTDMEKFLRPATLFNCEKFDGYVNECETVLPPARQPTEWERQMCDIEAWGQSDSAGSLFLIEESGGIE
jgi:uncharacterized phage protein (TIGR02220 family)